MNIARNHQQKQHNSDIIDWTRQEIVKDQGEFYIKDMEKHV